VADLNLDMTYPANKKTRALVRILGKRADAIPIRMWCYVGKNHPDTGDLVGYSSDELAVILMERPVGKVLSALVDVGFLEVVENGYHVHDWEDRAGHLRVFHDRARKAAHKRWSKYDSSSATSTTPSTARGNAPSNAPVRSLPVLSCPSPSPHGVLKTGSRPGNGRDPLGPSAPPEARAAAEKRRLGDAWFESGGATEKPEAWLTAVSYGPESRNDERERLLLWEGGDDAAFTRHVFEMGPTP
jgi:hypothetical protein